jgi:hypothetical protein
MIERVWRAFMREAVAERGSVRKACTKCITVGLGAIAFALWGNTRYTSFLQARGGAVWQLVGLITRRSQVQILPPQPSLKVFKFQPSQYFL